MFCMAQGGDSKILFSDTMAKVNRKAKAQLRALILTDMNIYKYEPKKYKIKKEAIPLAKVQSIHCSSQEDCYVIVKMEAPLRDLVMDFGTNGSEMCSEFVTVLYSQMQVRCPFLSFCPSVLLSFCASVLLCFCASVLLSFCPSASLPLCLSASLPLCLSHVLSAAL